MLTGSTNVYTYSSEISVSTQLHHCIHSQSYRLPWENSVMLHVHVLLF